MKIIGLIVNPIAGMGGRVGLKGTDTPEILEEARSRGAEPLCPGRTRECFTIIKDDLADVKVLTCPGKMGRDVLDSLGIAHELITADGEGSGKTLSADTISAASLMKDKVDLLVFAGGDGTARDISGAVGQDVPILGIPAGVKMHSSVFGTNPANAAGTIRMFLQDQVEFGDGEVLDIDEDAYRAGMLNVKLYGVAKVPLAAEFMQTSKQVFQAGSQESVLEEIGDFFKELADERPETLFFLGAGTTLGVVKRWLEVNDPTLLGIDAYYQGEQIGADLNEKGLLDLMDSTEAQDFAICVSPIGSQGFVLGRGSQQFSPEVLRRVGEKNVYIVATPDKVSSCSTLRVDTGDPALDKEFSGYRRVITGFRIQTMLKLGN